MKKLLKNKIYVSVNSPLIDWKERKKSNFATTVQWIVIVSLTNRVEKKKKNARRGRWSFQPNPNVA